jgi:DnaJ like chaperone protein
VGIFAQIGRLIAGGAGAAVSGLRAVLARLPRSEIRRQAAFAIAVIALSAKMAKADGVVTRTEVDAFCRIFTIPAGDEKNVSRVYNLAKRDIAGFEAYARTVAHLLADDPAILEALLDGLFDIAKADGAVHERELVYLAQVARLFGFSDRDFARIRARHVVLEGEADPFLVLNADPAWSDEELRRHYLLLVRENHPDRLMARGVPEEFVRIANDRLAAINTAWERIETIRSSA